MFLQSLPAINRVAMSFLNAMRYRRAMLCGDKDVELCEYKKNIQSRHARYTHVFFRMSKRLRDMKKLRKFKLNTKHVMAKLGKRLGPFHNAKDVMKTAEREGWKIGMNEEELVKFMIGKRKVNGGPKKGGYFAPRPRSIMLYELREVHETDRILVNDCSNNQAGFHPHSFKRTDKMVTHFEYITDQSKLSDCVESDLASGTVVMPVVPTACSSAAAALLSVTRAAAAEIARGAAQQRSTVNGLFRLGKTQSRVVSAPVVRDAVRIPRKQPRRTL